MSDYRMYFDKLGKELDQDEWMLLYHEKYKRVAETTLADGKWVSTVWLGLNHNYTPSGPPLIFETMVFDSLGGTAIDDYTERYSTLEQAQSGHIAIVDSLKD